VTQAHSAAVELSVSDDDIIFLVALCAKDPVFAGGYTAGAMMQLAGMIVESDALGARLLRSLAAMGSDPQQALELLQLADIRLASGADQALRAEVWNEIAILLVGQGRYTDAGEKAQAACDLALEVGADQIARMALGNIAFSLMQQRRFGEALDTLDRLAREQTAAGDIRGLEITRSNIAACNHELGQ
jgi:tetratricopeptide (TPR) repeat protein